MYNSYVHNATHSSQTFLVRHLILPPNIKRRQFALVSVSILLLWLLSTIQSYICGILASTQLNTFSFPTLILMILFSIQHDSLFYNFLYNTIFFILHYFLFVTIHSSIFFTILYSTLFSFLHYFLFYACLFSKILFSAILYSTLFTI